MCSSLRVKIDGQYSSKRSICKLMRLPLPFKTTRFQSFYFASVLTSSRECPHSAEWPFGACGAGTMRSHTFLVALAAIGTEMQSAPQLMTGAVRDWESEREGWCLENRYDAPNRLAGVCRSRQDTAREELYKKAQALLQCEEQCRSPRVVGILAC